MVEEQQEYHEASAKRLTFANIEFIGWIRVRFFSSVHSCSMTTIGSDYSILGSECVCFVAVFSLNIASALELTDRVLAWSEFMGVCVCVSMGWVFQLELEPTQLT